MLLRWKPIGFLLLVSPCIASVLAKSNPSPSIDTTKHVSLSAWRKTDARGQACASCHSPDGLELAAYNFSDEDLMRRAKAHLSLEDAKQIVDQIHTLRENYHIDKPLDPMMDRPMQPGGSVLEGATSLARDKEFAMSLKQILPTFFGRIDSLAQAERARAEILRVDLAKLKIGIPFNRISEDVFHGNEHATIANWISDVKLAQETPFQLEDAYLSNPTAANFNSIESYYTSSVMRPLSPAQEVGLSKKRSLLYLQHDLRMHFLSLKNTAQPAYRNPMWNVGEQGRIYSKSKMDSLGMPSDIVAKKIVGPDTAEQMKQIRLPWYWMGWVMDPSLQHTSLLAETNRADYFTRFLTSDGPYPMHEAFMITRKIMEESFVPKSWIIAVPQHLKINYSGFVDDNGVTAPLPAEAEHASLFSTFTANSFRMNLYLALDEMSKSHTVYQRPMELQQIRRMKAFFKDASDQALANRLIAAIAKAKDGARMGKGT